MGIFVIDKAGTKEYTKKPVGKENYIEDFLEKHIEVLDPGIILIGRQVRTGSKKLIDLMGLDRDGNTVIIELKRGISPREVISQVLDYAVWTESVGYDDLNNIIKKKHLLKHDNLHDLFKSKFNSVPEPWNNNQKIYIVAEQLDAKTREMAQYLRNRDVDIKCVELNFYENAEKEIVSTNFVVGDQSDTINEMNEKSSYTWDDALDNTNEDTRKTVESFIEAVKKELNPDGGPQSRWYYMRVPDKPTKNQFGAIICQKKSAYVSFRVDPDTFQHDDNSEIKSISRWFFTKGTERRVNLTRSNFDLILRCLKHAYDVTSKL